MIGPRRCLGRLIALSLIWWVTTWLLLFARVVSEAGQSRCMLRAAASAALRRLTDSFP
jgi:hypothetical protein